MAEPPAAPPHPRWLAALAAGTLLSLALAAAWPVPRLWAPLFVAALAGAGAILELARLLLWRLAGPRAPAGLALLCGLLAVLVQAALTWHAPPPVPAGLPDPPPLGLLALAIGQAVAAVTAVFAGLAARRERPAALLGLAAGLLVLALIGRAGLTTRLDLVRGLGAGLTAAALALVAGVGALARGWQHRQGS